MKTRHNKFGREGSGGPSPRSSRSSVRAVTLLELVVTLVVIAVGIALLFPMFRNLQSRSTTATCASNLKQIGTAMLNYAFAHGNRLPRWNEGQPAAPLDKMNYEPAGENAGVPWPQILVDAGYIEDKSPAFLCPSNKEEITPGKTSEISYTMNARVADHRLTSVPTPAKLVLLTERYLKRVARKQDGIGWAALVGSEHVGSDHEKSSSYLFMDGHVQIMPFVGNPTGGPLSSPVLLPWEYWHLPEVVEETEPVDS